MTVQSSSFTEYASNCFLPIRVAGFHRCANNGVQDVQVFGRRECDQRFLIRHRTKDTQFFIIFVLSFAPLEFLIVKNFSKLSRPRFCSYSVRALQCLNSRGAGKSYNKGGECLGRSPYYRWKRREGEGERESSNWEFERLFKREREGAGKSIAAAWGTWRIVREFWTMVIDWARKEIGECRGLENGIRMLVIFHLRFMDSANNKPWSYPVI